jgi:hypothetical protein
MAGLVGNRVSRWWDVFLDVGVSLIPVWILVFVLVFVAAAKLTGH